MENNRGKLKKEELNLVEENSTELNSVEESKKTILVVDDEKPIVDILTYNLQKEGYATLEANDGEEAIRIATEQIPDLIRYYASKNRWTNCMQKIKTYTKCAYSNIICKR